MPLTTLYSVAEPSLHCRKSERVAKRWVDTLNPGTINTWDLLKKAFIQRNIRSSSSNDGLVALVNKLDNLGQDLKKLKESVHAIQVGCQICKGPHLDMDCPLNEEVKQVEEVRYGEFGRTTPFNGSNGGKFRVGPPGYLVYSFNTRNNIQSIENSKTTLEDKGSRKNLTKILHV
ncbi:hypothetical protein Tco_0426192 [Tanacetum coccineum]